MSERLNTEGHLSVMEKEATKHKILLNGLVKSLRENLDLLMDVKDLDAGLIAEQGLEFASKHATYCEILAKIEKAKKILGRD